MDTSKMYLPDGEFTGAMIRKDNPTLLPFSQTVLPL